MEKLRLQWHDHGNELSRLSRDLFGHEGLTDVTLTCRGGTPFHAHKMILAAASTYFRNFFLEVQGKIAQHQVIFMKDIESSEMEYLLRFIYLGEVDIPGLELERLIAISKELGIIGLDAVKKEENGGEPRTLKRKLQTTPESPEPLTPKIAKVKNDAFYNEEPESRDFFDGYMDGGEEDTVTESDVGFKSENEEATPNEANRWISDEIRWLKVKMSASAEPLKFQPSKSNNPVWAYYEKCTTEERAKCKKCGSLLSCKGGTTGAMRGHLKAKHDIKVGFKIKPSTSEDGESICRLESFQSGPA